MAELPDALAGALEDRYTLQGLLGRGGMATVYLARDVRHDRLVALKVLSPGLAAAIGPERFLREIRTTAALRHPGILPLYDSGRTARDEFLYYVMPYIEGETLRARLERDGQLDLDSAVRITVEVAEALAYAHRGGVIHRDIKPENILIDSGHAIVADFGIARAVDQSGSARLTETGLSLGTPHYMSPEQATGADHVAAPADIYSLGCVLYEMLAGEPPFTGPTASAVLAKHATGERPSVRVLRDTVPPALDAVLTRAMARSPGDRYADAAAFGRAVAAAAREPVAPAAPRRRAMRTGLTAVGVVVAALAFAWIWRALRPAPALDPNRIMVFPLVVSEGYPGGPSVGEDLATMIGTTLDGTGPLRWIDGWTQLPPDHRQDARDLAAAEARATARAQHCGYYVIGRILALDDSTAQIGLSLYDVGDGTEVKRSAATTPLGQAWKGVRAVNALLPALIPDAAADPAAEWEQRPPIALASFLLGEAAFRRLRVDEAHQQFQAAVAADSTFALAALRGAQAASWVHRGDDAAALIRVAARQPLPPHHAAFVRGYQAYLDGDADSAVAGFRAALTLDPDMGAAWLQLGETWSHLLPGGGAPDDSALAAFGEAMDRDSAAVTALYHVIQVLLRRGNLERAGPLLDRLLAANLESDYADPIRIMDRCVRLGPDRVAWDSLARALPFPLLLASRHFAAGGAQLPCAEAGFDALVRNDTTAAPEAENRRFFDMLGLVNVLLADGRTEEAVARVDAFVERWGTGSSVFLLAAPYYPALAARAAAVARNDAATHGPTYARLAFPIRLWELGVFEAKRGNADVAQAVAGHLAAQRPPLAASIEAHVALARGDSALAVTLFDAVVPPIAAGDALSWDEALAGGADRLEYARLLAARGEHRRTLDVADVLDSPSPFVYPLYLAPGLRLRLEAAEALGDTRLAAQLRARLATLSP